MIFNTIYTSPASPVYPSGDSTKYPMVDIPIGTIKLYTEQDISDLIHGIQVLGDTEATFTIVEACTELDYIESCVEDIVDAVNAMHGTAGDIPLSDIPAAIRTIPTNSLKVDNFELIISEYTVI